MRTAAQAVRRTLLKPVAVRGLRLPPPALLVLAAIGGCLLLVVATTRWGAPQDEQAYWLAGQRLASGQQLYDPTAVPGTPYAYFYPPPLAQAIAPLTHVLGPDAFSALWTILILGCLLWLARGQPLVALAFVAFIPVAIELWYRNVHLVLAVLLVLGLRGAPWAFALGASIKVTPGLGIVYLAARGRWRDAAVATLVGVVIFALSVAIAPGTWDGFLHDVLLTAPTTGASLVPIPYLARAAAGLGLAVVAGRLPERFGDPLLIVSVVLANPTLWATSLSMLIAIIPILWLRPHRLAAVASSAGDPAVA